MTKQEKKERMTTTSAYQLMELLDHVLADAPYFGGIYYGKIGGDIDAVQEWVRKRYHLTPPQGAE